jgi:hypothetical protein
MIEIDNDINYSIVNNNKYFLNVKYYTNNLNNFYKYNCPSIWSDSYCPSMINYSVISDNYYIGDKLINDIKVDKTDCNCNKYLNCNKYMDRLYNDVKSNIEYNLNALRLNNRLINYNKEKELLINKLSVYNLQIGYKYKAFENKIYKHNTIVDKDINTNSNKTKWIIKDKNKLCFLNTLIECSNYSYIKVTTNNKYYYIQPKHSTVLETIKKVEG